MTGVLHSKPSKKAKKEGTASHDLASGAALHESVPAAAGLIVRPLHGLGLEDEAKLKSPLP